MGFTIFNPHTFAASLLVFMIFWLIGSAVYSLIYGPDEIAPYKITVAFFGCSLFYYLWCMNDDIQQLQERK